MDREKNFQAEKGILNLQDWNPNSSIVDLQGKWQFCWDEFIDPLAQEEIWINKCSYQDVPKYWKFYNLNGENLPIYGKATYRLQVNLPKAENYGIMWTEIMSAFKIFVNGELMTTVGVVGDSKKNTKAELKPGVDFIGYKSGVINIVIHVANFNHENHGFWQSLYIGQWDLIVRELLLNKILDSIAFGSIFIIGLYYLVVFWFRKLSKDFFYFGVFCVFMGFRQTTLENHVFLSLFPFVEFDTYIRLLYAFIYMSGISLNLFLYNLFPRDFSKLFIQITTSIFALFLLTLFFPVVELTRLGVFMFGLIITVPLIILYFLFKAVRNKREGARTIFVANLIFNLTVINDVLFTLGYGGVGYFSSIGLLIFILMEAYVLSIKYSTAILRAEQLDFVTERSIAMEKLAREASLANQAKSQFLATMSHEIRTPMNGILGITELLKSSELDDKQTEMVRLIQNSGESLLTILNDILDYSKMDAGKIDLDPRDFSLNELVQQIYSLYKMQADKKDLYFNLIYATGEKYLHGDSIRIRQIILNLLSNAIKFTDNGGITIAIEIFQESSDQHSCQLRITVTDTGIGIPDSKTKHLFEMFKQLDSGISRKYGGTGLGLAITQKLVQLMNGRIYLNHEYKSGAEFIVELPMALVTGEKIQAQEIKRDITQLKGIKILVAEDDKTNQFLIANILNKLQIQYHLVDDGVAAISEVMQNDYDIILMDINMPKLDGISATSSIINNDKIKHKPIIIAVTADAFQEDRDKCKSAGMKDFLPKPYQRKQIEEIICYWAEKIREKKF